MVNKSSTHYVVKDPLKTQYFRFSLEEYEIIELFNGERTLKEIVEVYNKNYPNREIDLEIIEDYRNNLEEMNLLTKSKKDMNVMLVEKVKEMREFQLLSKKGSLLYRRFPIVDPDKFFDRIIPHIGWIWSKGFLLFSSLIMLAAVAIIFSNWDRFNEGMYQLFSFSEMSMANLFFLWVIIYATIAMHEVGHGLTCKYYGGEVHEIGFLLLFFQPCLYCNVNDAWLFDKKWKQIMVTIAGGYVEFFIGSICAFIWVLTSENSMINTLSFQVMTICSLSTVFFNFNPLIKLDGYYLLSDFLEVPNLKEDSAKYLKLWVKKTIFRMPVEEFYASQRDKRILLMYGAASATWMFFLLTGLVGMAKGMLVDKFHAWGMLITGFVAYKLFKGHVMDSLKFMASFYMQYKSWFDKKENKFKLGGLCFALVVLLFVPIHYKIKGACTLEPSKTLILRANSDGKVQKFLINDGDLVNSGDDIVRLSNMTVEFDRKIANYNYLKTQRTFRQQLYKSPEKTEESLKDVSAKKLTLDQKTKRAEALLVKVPTEVQSQAIVSCEEQEKLQGSFLKEGDEICRIQEIESMRTVIEVDESEVRFLAKDQDVKFKLFSDPGQTYLGKIADIKPTGKADPKNPNRKIYHAIINIKSNGQLRPSMKGLAKIYAEPVSIFKYSLLKLAKAIRLDLFF